VTALDEAIIDYLAPHYAMAAFIGTRLHPEYFLVRVNAGSLPKERRVALQVVDLNRKPISAREIRRFVQHFGWTGILDTEGKAYIEAGLKYLMLSESELIGRIERNAALLRLPLVRAGKLVSVGHDEASWKAMLCAARWMSMCRESPRTKALSLFKPTAFFVFLAAATVTGVVPADFRLIAAKWLIQNSTVDKGPGFCFFAKGGHLVVLNRFIFLRIFRDELYASLGILFFSAENVKYLKTLPLRSFGPFARALAVKFSSGAGMDGPLDEVDVCRHVSGIPRAH
jgi:arsenate reductase-like glutaredoxin family protein